MLYAFKTAHLTFYSRDFYDALALRWRGIGGGFILLTSLLSAFVVGLAIAAVRDTLQDYIPRFAASMPQVTYHQKSISIDKPSPYSISLKDKTDTFIVFDTGYSIGTLDELERKMQEKNTYVLITATQVAIRQEGNRSIEINDLDFGATEVPIVITADDWKYYAELFLSWAVIAGIAGVFFWNIAYGLVLAAIGGLIVKLLAQAKNKPVDFAAGMRIAAAASVPALVLGFVITLFGTSMPVFIKFAIWCGYSFFAVDSIFTAYRK